MGKVAIIGVGQSKFVRSYPGSIRELAFEAFKEAALDAGISTGQIDASVLCSAPEYDKQRSPSAIVADQDYGAFRVFGRIDGSLDIEQLRIGMAMQTVANRLPNGQLNYVFHPVK
jgi:acetyl-CoA acetyltransferase